VEDEGLAELFWAVARRLRHGTRDALAPWDVTPSQARALSVLTRHGPQRLTALAEHLRIAARSATEVVDHLQERGLVERRPDPADRRATLITPTPGGAAAGAQIRAAREAGAERLFAALTPGDRAELGRILRQLRD
jgi:DNA-binding MarR family transcriptional regulator